MKRSSMGWKPSEPAALNARHVLPQMVRDYFKSGRKLDGDSSAKDMHAFRLKTKRLRYTLEAFVSLYGPGLKPKIESLRPIQNALGDANDCEVLRADMGDRLPPRVRAYVANRAEEKRKEFLRYWREEFDTAAADQKWERYLTHSARTHSSGTENT
jgi:CHAD domain-containing protein